MAEPLSVAVRRGKIIESVHLVHAVAVREGEIVAEAGNPAIAASLRSSAKPLQALPLARARDDLTTEDLAIASASHFGTPAHIEAVRALLQKTGGSEDELECGLQPGRPAEPIYHNCSGKHAAMIAVCRARGWPVEGYFRPDHPLQLELARPRRGRRRHGAATDRDRHRRLRGGLLRDSAGTRGLRVLPARAARRRATGSPRRCAPGPSSSAAMAEPIPS